MNKTENGHEQGRTDMNKDELINEEEIDPMRTIILRELLLFIRSLTVQDVPEMSHAALPHALWEVLGRPRHLLVEDGVLAVVPSDTLKEEAYFYCEDTLN